MTGKQTWYSADFKAKVVLEALRGELTTMHLVAKHGIHQTMVVDWKWQAIKDLTAVAAMARSFQWKPMMAIGKARPPKALSRSNSTSIRTLERSPRPR